jgi:hypothetical protein
MAEQLEAQMAEQLEVQMAEWPEAQVAGQPGAQEEQQVIHHHHQIHYHLITKVQEDDQCPDNNCESKNWNSLNPLKSRNQKNSLGMPGKTSTPGGY